MSVSLFFDPSAAFDLEQSHVVAIIAGEVILDTVVVNTRVNSSLLMKCLDIDVIKNKSIDLTINNQRAIVQLDSKRTDCLAIFTSYDDHTKIQQEYHKIKTERAKNGQTIEMKLVMDSIKQRLGSEYGSIIIDVQKDRCFCND
ncbi:MAG: hypothetical protein V4721_00225 [Bacteroidota bacterium]